MPNQILKAYKVRLYPNEDQQIFFAKSFGCTRFIWNKMLADKIEHYTQTNTTPKLTLSLKTLLLNTKKNLSG